MHTPHLWLGFTFSMRIPVWEQGSLMDSAHPWDSPLGSRQPRGLFSWNFSRRRKKPLPVVVASQHSWSPKAWASQQPHHWWLLYLWSWDCNGLTLLESLKNICESERSCNGKRTKQVWNTQWLQPLCWISVQVCQRIPCSYGRLRLASTLPLQVGMVTKWRRSRSHGTWRRRRRRHGLEVTTSDVDGWTSSSDHEDMKWRPSSWRS